MPTLHIARGAVHSLDNVQSRPNDATQQPCFAAHRPIDYSSPTATTLALVRESHHDEAPSSGLDSRDRSSRHDHHRSGSTSAATERAGSQDYGRLLSSYTPANNDAIREGWAPQRIDVLRMNGQGRAADRIERCRDGMRCFHRSCPICSGIDARQKARQYGKKLWERKRGNVVLATFTVHVEHSGPAVAASVKRAMSDTVATLARYRRAEQKRWHQGERPVVLGGFYAMHAPEGFAHIHSLLDVSVYHRDDLEDILPAHLDGVWESSAGKQGLRAQLVHVEPVGCTAGDYYRVFDYMLKDESAATDDRLSESELAQRLLLQSGKRRINAFGSMLGR